ncbi:AbiV family abortive infection protein [Dissulfurispira sp.]|uniref:AbiV family abortive infection protein n=1 Tax=Dissulfurispira sp. TaxID=2817609 RepID=UPI002FDA6272
MKTKARQKSKEGHISSKHWTSILKLYRACLNNANDLTAEAELLYKHEHYARAVTLSLLAMEEIGKSQIVADFFNDMVSSSELENAFKRHE